MTQTQPGIFGAEPISTAPDAAIQDARFDWYTAFCRDKFGMSDSWAIYGWSTKNHQTPQEFILVEGAVCKERYTKGKRKGHIDYRKCEVGTKATLSIRSDELAKFKRDWSARTDKCGNCYGTGQEWCSWNHLTGNRYRDCGECNATGKLSAAPPAKAGAA